MYIVRRPENAPLRCNQQNAKEFFFLGAKSDWRREAVGGRNNGAQSGTKHLKKHLKEERTRASYSDWESVGFSLVASFVDASGSDGCGGKSAGCVSL